MATEPHKSRVSELDARATLARYGAAIALDKILQHCPEGPVTTVSTRYASKIEYFVIIGPLEGVCWVIWNHEIILANNIDPVLDPQIGAFAAEAARIQKEVATAASRLLGI